jgi:hypothetical protein
MKEGFFYSNRNSFIMKYSASAGIIYLKEELLKEWFLSDINKELEANALRNKIKELEEKLRGKE